MRKILIIVCSLVVFCFLSVLLSNCTKDTHTTNNTCTEEWQIYDAQIHAIFVKAGKNVVESTPELVSLIEKRENAYNEMQKDFGAKGSVAYPLSAHLFCSQCYCPLCGWQSTRSRCYITNPACVTYMRCPPCIYAPLTAYYYACWGNQCALP